MRKFKFTFFFDITVIAIVVAYLFFVVFQVDHEVPKVIELNEGKETSGEVIKVMTYNIAHGRGHLSMYDKSALGRNFNIRSKEEVVSRLDKITRLVQEEDIDILILEEVDFDATWSYHVDEALYIAKNAGFSNVVEGLKWSLDVPFLKIRVGNAILSKYPLAHAKNTKFKSETFFRRVIGGHSYLETEYLINKKAITVIGTHFDSDSDKAREFEAQELVERVIERQGKQVIVAGDLNAVTPETKRVNKQLRNRFTDLTLETFLKAELTPGVALFDFNQGRLRPNAEEMFTYSAENPHRLIDYIFTTPDLEVTQYYVVRKNLSDHFPLIGRIVV